MAVVPGRMERERRWKGSKTRCGGSGSVSDRPGRWSAPGMSGMSTITNTSTLGPLFVAPCHLPAP